MSNREPLEIVRIIQPKCSRTFGVAPCNATGTKCYNTDKTCKFRAALDMTDTLTLDFVKPVANRTLDSATAYQPWRAIPSLAQVSTSPTVLNVAAGNDDYEALGARAVCDVSLRDHPHNDNGIDPYAGTRGFDQGAVGTFWGKWLARNPYHVGYTLQHFTGNMGDALASMVKREYSIDRVIVGRNGVQISAKDILRKITDTGVTAPALSNGALSLDMTIGATSFQAAGAALADYPATGWVCVDTEVIAYTARAIVAGNVEFTGLTRGALNTTAAAHTLGARVQRVLSYSNAAFQDVIYDLLTVWGGIAAGYIDKAAWDNEKTEWRSIYNFSRYIVAPVAISKLVGEVCQEAQSHIWWDERDQKIKLRAQRAVAAPYFLTDNANILEGSFAYEERPDMRASRVYVFYGLRNPTLSQNDRLSYENGEAYIDLLKEAQYGEAATKEIFCKWTSSSIIANSLAQSYQRRFADVRRYATFDLSSATAASLWTGDAALVRHFVDQDTDGQARLGQWLIISARAVDGGARFSFEAEDNESAGVLWEWIADSDTRPNTEVGAWVDENGTDGAGNELPFTWL